MKVPTYTIDLLTVLKQLNPDTLETDPLLVGTPEYWKKVGVVELIRTLEAGAGISTLKDKEA